MKAIKIIAIDIDGTLVNSDKQVTSRVKQAIKAAKAQQIKVVICTGRPLTGVKALLQELELDAQDDQYVICFGGAATYSTSGELIDERPISYDDYIDLEALARKLRVHFHAFPRTDSILQIEILAIIRAMKLISYRWAYLIEPLRRCVTLS